MASPFVPVPIEDADGEEFLALEYCDHQDRKSLLESSSLLETRMPIQLHAGPEEQTRSKMIQEFVKSIIRTWPQEIRRRCLGLQRFILESLKTIKTFIIDDYFPPSVRKWACDKLEMKKTKQHKQMHDSQPMQTSRDQEFLDEAIRSVEHQAECNSSGEEPDSSDVEGLDLFREARVNHLDAIYYIVAEALGFRPGDLGFNYNQSFDEKGRAHANAKPLLVVSDSAGPPMLGLMSRSCYTQNPIDLEIWNGKFMTVGLRDEAMEGAPTQGNETCLYEVELINDKEGYEPATWRIVGVWVPVNLDEAKVKDVVGGWFGPGAKMHGKLI
ncbi:hypothetical protein PG985_014004 [Apiospora marii]|uniref:uncharacterized protein n=1 Tax=Apiospora marii TaxID=335849 RepID=UPI00312D2687